MQRLSTEALTSLDARVEKPSYDRGAVTPGIVHFGVGGFHRAHEAMYLDRLMNDGKALDWGICGVGTLPRDARMRDVMAEQDCLYTLVVKHPDGTLEPRVIGSLVDYLFAPDDPEAVLETLADPATRIVSLTITEGGYLVHPVTGEFDADGRRHPGRPGARSRARHGVRVHHRGPGPSPRPGRAPVHGHVLRQHPGQRRTSPAGCSTAFARLRDAELADWVEREVPFPNSMVDRITPVTTEDDIAAAGRRSSASRTGGPWCASRSRSGCWRTASATTGRRWRRPACSWSPTSSPTS